MVKHDTLLLACGTRGNRGLLRNILGDYYNLLEAANTRQAMLLLEQNIDCIAAVMLDVTVPERIDRALLESAQFADYLSQAPIIAIVPDDDPEILQDAFLLGAADAIPLNYDPIAMLHRIENIVELSGHKRSLEELVQEQSEVLRSSNNAIVDALSSIIEYRSLESGQHTLRIRHFTKLLLDEIVRNCPEYGLTESDVDLISSASALHDIGKISIPDAILMKPGKLTEEEREVMNTHALTGCRILQRLGDLGDPEYMRYARNICHYHHERWDGKGYPQGLSGDDIPICAQAVGLADVYDALTTNRVYKDAVSFDTAVNMILNGECGIFSPKLLECFKQITDDYEALAQAYADGLAPETEQFDVPLSAPSRPVSDGMDRVHAKYQALIHYAGAFLLELDMDQKLFHLIYNPYPEFADFQDVTNFSELEKMIMDTLIIPEQRERMGEMIDTGIKQFLHDGLRRVNYNFRFRSRRKPEGEEFVITLLRTSPSDSTRNTLTVLCRKAEDAPVRTLTDSGLTAALPGATYFCRIDQDLTLKAFGSETFSLAGYSQEELKSCFDDHLMELVIPEDREKLHIQIREQLSRGTGLMLDYRMRHKDGRILWIMNKCRLVTDTDGQEYLGCFLTDISSVKQSEEELQKKLRRYEIILSQTENVLFDWEMDTDEISFSDTWETIFGTPPLASNVRENLRGGSSFFHPDDLPLLFDKLSSLEGGSSYEMAEVRIATTRGRYIWCRLRATAIRDDAGRLVKIAGVIINVDAEKQAEQALQDQARRDSLTKLLNKETARKQAEDYFVQFAGNLHCAMLIIDLDDFKQVNDRYGHLFGDAVLTKAAKEIKKLFRNQDIIARIGGDEFMVLMRGVSDQSLVESRCARLVSIFQTAFRSQHYQIPVSCSVGVALAPDHGSSYVDLFRRADQALYQAKAQGKNSFMFYSHGSLPISTGQHRQTAVGARIDSDDQPSLTNENIVRHAFQRLYSAAAADVPAAINDILALVGRQMNVSRVYVFENSPDNRFCSNTYEWCNDGIAPEIENLQSISYETDIPNYEDNFNEQGVFYCPDVKVLPQSTYDIVASQGIKSMLQCAILENGVFRGYIGFDECEKQRYWTKDQLQMLIYFAEMLSVFLLKKQEHERNALQARELSTILDNQNAWIYIIDPDTCELKYLNAKTKELDPDAQVGMRCYEALLGCDSQCENCPAANIHQTKTKSSIMDNPKFDLQVLADATLIHWEGKSSCLVTCRKLSVEGLEAIRKRITK